MKKIIANLKERVRHCSCVEDFCFLCSSTPDEKSVRLPVLRLSFEPFMLIIDHLKAFLGLCAFYAVIITLLSFLSGFSYVCMMGIESQGLLYCSTSNAVYVAYFLVKAVLYAIFSVRWAEIVFKHQNIAWGNLLMPGKTDVKTLGAFVAMILLNMVPLLSYYILWQSKPNPDWRVEVIFFAVVALGFLFPFVLLRFYSMLAFVINGEKLPPFKVVWDKTRGNTLRLLISFFLIIILALFAFTNFFLSFKAAALSNTVYIGFVSELLYNIIVLLILAVIVNNCFIQKEFLFGGKKNDSAAGN